jgi:hypothetical protein
MGSVLVPVPVLSGKKQLPMVEPRMLVVLVLQDLAAWLPFLATLPFLCRLGQQKAPHTVAMDWFPRNCPNSLGSSHPF